MNYLQRGWNITFNSIKKHKLLFALIVILQILMVASSLWLGTHYVLKILADTQGVISPLEQANYDSEQIQEGMPFTPDYTSIYNSYQSMLKNVTAFAVWMAVLFLVLNGIIWLLSHRLFQEGVQKVNLQNLKEIAKEAVPYFLKTWSAAVILFVPAMIASYYVLIHYIRLSDSFSTVLFILKIVLAVKLVLYYFLLVALVAAREGSWKNFAKSWVRLSIFNSSKAVLLFLLNAAALSISFTALYAATEYTESIILLLATGLLIIFMIVLTRIFWIATVKEIDQSK